MRKKVALAVTILCVGVLGFGVYSVYNEIFPDSVYACSSDKHKLPHDVAILCNRLTKGQWWHK